MIKDLVVNLPQILVKCVVMDIVFMYILARFGMLLCRSWGMKLAGAIKLDLMFSCMGLTQV